MRYNPQFKSGSQKFRLDRNRQHVIAVAYKVFRPKGRPLGHDEVLEMIRIMCDLKYTPSSVAYFERLDKDDDEYTSELMTSANADIEHWMGKVEDLFQEVLKTTPEIDRNFSGLTRRLEFPKDYYRKTTKRKRWNGAVVRLDQLCLLYPIANGLKDDKGSLLKEEYATDLATQKVFNSVADPDNDIIATLRVSDQLITKSMAQVLKGSEDLFMQKVERDQIDYANDLESGAIPLVKSQPIMPNIPLPFSTPQSYFDRATTSSFASLSIGATASGLRQPLVPGFSSYTAESSGSTQHAPKQSAYPDAPPSPVQSRNERAMQKQKQRSKLPEVGDATRNRRQRILLPKASEPRPSPVQSRNEGEKQKQRSKSPEVGIASRQLRQRTPLPQGSTNTREEYDDEEEVSRVLPAEQTEAQVEDKGKGKAREPSDQDEFADLIDWPSDIEWQSDE